MNIDIRYHVRWIAVLLAWTAAADAQSATKLAWDQTAPTLAAAQAQTYYATIDGSTIAVLTATCTGTAAPFVCAAPLPALLPGNHTLTATAVAGVVESAPSATFPFSVPSSPAALRLTK